MKRYVMLMVACLVVTFGPVVYAQVTAPETMPAATLFGQQNLISMIMSFYIPRGMELLKQWKKFPLLQEGARRLNQAVAVGVATVQSVGLTYTYHHGDDGWSFVMGSKHSSFEEFLIAFAVALGAQQFFYEQIPSVKQDQLARAIADAFKKSGTKLD